MSDWPGGDLHSIVQAGNSMAADGLFEDLAELVKDIESCVADLTVDETLSLRSAVSEWISAAAIMRAECALKLKQLQGGTDAARTYKDVSKAF